MLAPTVIGLMAKKSVGSPMVYITAAHIPHEQMEGYTFMYEDTDTDTAYYLKDNYSHRLPKVGDVVKFSSQTGKVTGLIEDYGFTVEVKDSTGIYKGMSGARVLDKSLNEIGFISSIKGDELTCISTR